MNVSTTGFYAVLKFQKQQYKKHMSNVVDFDALEAWVDVMTDDYKFNDFFVIFFFSVFYFSVFW